MVAVKSHLAQAFLKSIDPAISAVLVFGADVGLVGERASEAARRLAGRETPASEIIRIDDLDLEAEPERLSLELTTVPMFGGAKVVRATAGRRLNASLIKELLGGPPLTGCLVVEAGALRPDEAMRTTFERSDRAAAIACYGDEQRDLEGVVGEMLKAAGLSIEKDARQVLVSRLGADRALSRGEIEKLILYVGARREIGIDDVQAIVGDASEQALDRVLNAMAAGQPAEALAELDRSVTAGESPQLVALALQRHLQRLHRLRAAIDRGRSVEEALRQSRPPIHFTQQRAVASQLAQWGSRRLEQALALALVASRAARTAGPLETEIVEHLVAAVAVLAQKPRA
jgi:DNA polymerase-3 subunit delta